MEDQEEYEMQKSARDPMCALAEALATAQSQMKNAALNKVNPHFKAKFADLASVREATLPALNNNGLSIVQFTTTGIGEFELRTRLMHTGGGVIESAYPLPNDLAKPQAMGSALTYARRYSWSAMCGIAADEDDDGNAAQSEERAPKPEDGGAFGPLTKTKLQSTLRAITGEIDDCTDLGMLAALEHSYKAVLEQCKRDLPKWWDFDDGERHGLKQRLEMQRKKIEQSEEYAG